MTIQEATKTIRSLRAQLGHERRLRYEAEERSAAAWKRGVRLGASGERDVHGRIVRDSGGYDG